MACQIKDCSRKIQARGLCGKHYADYWFQRNMAALKPKPFNGWIQLTLPGFELHEKSPQATG